MTTKEWNNLSRSTRTDPCLRSFQRAIDARLSAGVAPLFNRVGSKTGNTLHTRLRLNATILNAHLFKIQKAISPCCECGSSKETVAHFVLNCPIFNVQRSELFCQISQLVPDFVRTSNATKLNMLLNGNELSKAHGIKIAYLFQNFLIKTKRFHT